MLPIGVPSKNVSHTVNLNPGQSYDKESKKAFDNHVLVELNRIFMKGMSSFTPGFQPPCRKPHLSLFYGVSSQEKQEEMQCFVREKYPEIFRKCYCVEYIELWKTGGGIDGIKNWQFVDRIAI